MARRFLNSSRQFVIAAERAGETKFAEGIVEKAVVPEVVCLAFAIELGLKALILLDKRRTVRVHELDVLYRRLSPGLRKAIEAAVPVPAYPRYVSSRTFKDVLEEHSRAFEEWRYVCEGGADLTADLSFLASLAKQVQAIADQRMSLISAMP